MRLFVRTTSLFFNQSLNILIINICVVLPILFIIFLSSDIAYFYMDEFTAGLLDTFFLIVGLSVAQIPFIKMAKQEAMGEYIQFADPFKSLLKHSPSIFAMGIAYGLIVVVGYTLYIVPGIVALVIFLLFPYSVLIDDQLHWQSFRRAITIGGSNFFMLLVVILFFLMIDAVLWWGILNGVMFFFQPNYISLAITHMVLQSLLLPFFSFVITFFYLKWTTNEEKNEYFL